MPVNPATRPIPQFGGLALALLLAGIAACPRAAHAVWSHDPNLGNNVVCVQTAIQTSVQTCSDGAGGAFFVWQDSRAGGGGPDIYAQRLNAAGVPQWTANGVALCTAAADQSIPSITADGSGGAIVTWQDLRSGANYDVYAQRVNAAGVPQWAANGVALCTAAGGQLSPVVVSDAAGGAIVAWNDNRVGTSDIYAQRVTAAGAVSWTANGVALCAAANGQDQVQLVADGAGGAIAAWEDFRVVTAADLYAQRVNATGVPQWTANGVALCTAAGDQAFPAIVSDTQGGAVIAWQDTRNGSTNTDVYAQRVNAVGAAQWSGNGIAVVARTGNQYVPRLCTDGFGGAIIAFGDFSAGNADVYLQRVNSGGALQWNAFGLAMGTGQGDQDVADLVSDGTGGAIVTWHDSRGGVSFDVYAQHVDASAALVWPNNGVAVSSANSTQTGPHLCADGKGGAIITWNDARSDAADIYAQRVDYNGALGNAEPSILSIRDVPNDNGGFVKVSWAASYLDKVGNASYLSYVVWRSVPNHSLLAGSQWLGRGITTDSREAMRTGRLWTGPFAAGDYAWEQIGYSSALGFAQYSNVIPTTSDSLSGSNPRTAFMVQLLDRSGNFDLLYSSAPDSGYSVDNLPPLAPVPFAASFDGVAAHLAWAPNAELDIDHYQIHRGPTPDFVPNAGTLFATTQSTSMDDAAGTLFFYKVIAQDTHGNPSPAAMFDMNGILDAPRANPVVLAFAAPSPNPARGTTMLRYALPRATSVRLAVFDPSGRRVRSLTDGQEAAGEHEVSFALADDSGRPLGSGLYFVRLEAEGRVLSRRIMAIR